MKPNFCAIISSPSHRSFFSRMKISLALVCLLAIFTAGCSQVVYRVNRDAPPRMGEKEAKDAVELSLTLIRNPVWLDSISLEGDYIYTKFTQPKRGAGSVLGTPGRYVSYGEISPYIEKRGEYFSVGLGLVAQSLYWKSEEDARLFLDAVY
ncbi:MAG: hypothetical protein L7F78_27270, partial [Syntrophales bacterium LBB04]|nr:hypothetical protein [Syntrophales bacterium LBB04]